MDVILQDQMFSEKNNPFQLSAALLYCLAGERDLDLIMFSSQAHLLSYVSGVKV